MVCKRKNSTKLIGRVGFVTLYAFTPSTKVKNIEKKKVKNIVQYYWLSGLDLSYAWQLPTFTCSLQSHLMYNLLENFWDVFFIGCLHSFFEYCWEKCFECLPKSTFYRKWLYDVVERSKMGKTVKKDEPLNGNESLFWILIRISLWQRLKKYFYMDMRFWRCMRAYWTMFYLGDPLRSFFP